MVREVEMLGVSRESWEDATRQLLARASQAVRHITGLDLIRSTAVVRDGHSLEYHVTVRVAFVAEPAALDR